MFQFFLEFLKSLRNIGAVAPSGAFLAKKMMKPIRFERAKCIVEYGPGTGIFTRELIRRKKKGAKLLLIEQNESFFRKLKERYEGHEGVLIVNGSAEYVKEYMEQYGMESVDYIVSGLPFTSLPVRTSEQILTATRKAIGAEGRFLTFQYSMAKKKFFQQYFHIADCLFELRNLPPAYVLVMRQKPGKSNSNR